MEKSNVGNQFEDFKKEINLIFEKMSVDADKFYNKEQKAAGVRLRKFLKEIKGCVQTASNQTSEIASKFATKTKN